MFKNRLLFPAAIHLEGTHSEELLITTEFQTFYQYLETHLSVYWVPSDLLSLEKNWRKYGKTYYLVSSKFYNQINIRLWHTTFRGKSTDSSVKKY